VVPAEVVAGAVTMLADPVAQTDDLLDELKVGVHLKRMAASVFLRLGIATAHREAGDAHRSHRALAEQGDYETLKRHGLSDSVLGVNHVAETVERRFADQGRLWQFVHRARPGFKS
jgi:hypothetical protein